MSYFYIYVYLESLIFKKVKKAIKRIGTGKNSMNGSSRKSEKIKGRIHWLNLSTSKLRLKYYNICLQIYESLFWLFLCVNSYTPEIDKDCNAIIAAKANPMTVAPIFAQIATLEDRIALNCCVQERGNVCIVACICRIYISIPFFD